MKKALKIFLVIIVILFALGLVKDILIRSAVVIGVKAAVGVDVLIGSLSLGILSQSVRMKDVKVYNPEGFPTKEVLVDIPEVAVQLDILALLKNTLHVRYLRLYLKEVRVIKNKEGKMNVNSLKLPPKSEKEMLMTFDLVSLRVDKVVLEDHYRQGDKPKGSVYFINIEDKEFRNIKSSQELGAAVMMAALNPAGLSSAFTLGTQVLRDVTNEVNAITNVLKGLGR